MSRWLLILGWLCLCFETYSQNPGNDVNPLDTLNPEVPKVISKASVQLDSLKKKPIEILDSLKDAGDSKLDTLQKIESEFQRILGDARDTINHQVPKLQEISPVQQKIPETGLDINSKTPNPDLKIIPNMGWELDAPKLPDTNFSTPGLDTDLSLPDMPYDTAGLDKESLADRVEQEAESRLKESNIIDIPDQGMADHGDLLATEFEGMGYFPDDANRFKKEALQKSQLAIQEKFRANADKVEAAQQHMAELKQKYSSIESLKEGKATKVNSLKDKSFWERSLIGISIRSVRTPLHPRGDLGLSYGYKLTRKWLIHGGYYYRVEINPDELSFHGTDIHGPMLSTTYMMRKNTGFFLAFENRNSAVINQAMGGMNKNNSYRTAMLIPGIVRHYKISKKVQGSLRLGYNVLYRSLDHNSSERIIVSNNFEIKLKK